MGISSSILLGLGGHLSLHVISFRVESISQAILLGLGGHLSLHFMSLRIGGHLAINFIWDRKASHNQYDLGQMGISPSILFVIGGHLTLNFIWNEWAASY